MAIRLVTPVAAQDRTRLQSHFSLPMYLKLCKATGHAIIWDIVADGWSDEDVKYFKGSLFNSGRQGYPIEVYRLNGSYGPGVARNLMLAQYAADDLVLFHDADDDKYADAAHLLTALQAHPEADLAYGRLRSLLPDGKIKDWPFYTPVTVTSVVGQQNPLVPGQLAIRAGAAKSVGGFEPFLICGEDGNLWRRIIERNKNVVGLDVLVGQYTWRADSQSKALNKFHERAFHLDKNLYGPMGQKLDEAARTRAKKAEDALSIADRIHALCDTTDIDWETVY